MTSTHVPFVSARQSVLTPRKVQATRFRTSVTQDGRERSTEVRQHTRDDPVARIVLTPAAFASCVELEHFQRASGLVHQPALAHVVIAEPRDAFVHVPDARLRRQHFDDEIGCAPNFVSHHCRAVAGDEEQVGLHDERPLGIEDHVEGPSSIEGGQARNCKKNRQVSVVST